MATLTVHVNGTRDDDRVLAMMFDVVAPDGRMLAQGTASPNKPATVQLPDIGVQRVHVIGYSPNGRTSEQAYTYEPGWPNNDVYLSPASSPHEWLQWVTPFRSLSHLQDRAGPKRAIGRVWMVLWEFREEGWAARPFDGLDYAGDTGMREVHIDVPKAPHLLQVGGDEVAWRFVSLPPGAKVRVALTRNRSLDPDFDSVEVTVGRVDPKNELIMSYLSRGAEVEAARLGEVWESADLALYEKVEDPISAAAGAYLLFKMGRLEARRSWVENLVRWSPGLADGPIIAAALTLQCCGDHEETVRQYLNLAISRGVPLFSLGISMLVETMAAVHRGAEETQAFKAGYLLARAYNQAHASSGAYFSFYGKSPAQPSWIKYRGAADAPVADPDDVALSNSGGTQSRRVDFDAAADMQRSPIDGGVSTFDPSAPNVRLADFRSIETAAYFYAQSDGDSAGNLVRVPKVEGSWLDQRQANAFTVFDGDD